VPHIMDLIPFSWHPGRIPVYGHYEAGEIYQILNAQDQDSHFCHFDFTHRERFYGLGGYAIHSYDLGARRLNNDRHILPLGMGSGDGRQPYFHVSIYQGQQECFHAV